MPVDLRLMFNYMSRFLCILRFDKYIGAQKTMTNCIKMAIGRRSKALSVIRNTKIAEIAAKIPMKGYRRTKVKSLVDATVEIHII